MNIVEIMFIIYLIVIQIIYILSFIPHKVKKKKITKIPQVNTIDEIKEKIIDNKIYINNTDCSIILYDSVPENIIKNYNILTNNIENKLVNGFTLKENIMLKSICNKLNVSNLKNIDLNNFNILNKIDIDEYIFLRSITEDN